MKPRNKQMNMRVQRQLLGSLYSLVLLTFVSGSLQRPTSTVKAVMLRLGDQLPRPGPRRKLQKRTIAAAITENWFFGEGIFDYDYMATITGYCC